MSGKWAKKLADLAEKVVCGPDDDKALSDEIRKAQDDPDPNDTGETR